MYAYVIMTLVFPQGLWTCPLTQRLRISYEVVTVAYTHDIVISAAINTFVIILILVICGNKKKIMSLF